MKEKTLDIYDGRYSVNTMGEVFSSRNNQTRKRKKLKLQKNKEGYLYLNLRISKGESKAHLAHRLVGIAFIPPIKDKEIINHLNEIRHDNRVENLEWTDTSGNWHYSSGGKSTEEFKQSKLTYNQAQEIRQLRKDGMSIRGLVEKYNITKTPIWDILKNRTYCIRENSPDFDTFYKNQNNGTKDK